MWAWTGLLAGRGAGSRPKGEDVSGLLSLPQGVHRRGAPSIRPAALASRCGRRRSLKGLPTVKERFPEQRNRAKAPRETLRRRSRAGPEFVFTDQTPPGAGADRIGSGQSVFYEHRSRQDAALL